MDESFARNLDQTGQHYMIDSTIIKFIVNSAELEKDDVVLEIGYGKGALTKELAKKCKVIAIDIEDNKFEAKNVVFINDNILNVFNQLYEQYNFNKIVANIPYNISEPLMKLIFKKHKELELVVMTVGKNFSNILTTNNNRIGVIASHLYDIELLKTVKPKSFSPPPRVDSEVILIEPKSDVLSEIYAKIVMLDDRKLKNAFEKILADKTKREVKKFTTHSLFEKKLYELNNREFLELDSFLTENLLIKDGKNDF